MVPGPLQVYFLGRVSCGEYFLGDIWADFCVNASQSGNVLTFAVGHKFRQAESDYFA